MGLESNMFTFMLTPKGYSKPMTFHYSFDFAQQVHYRADPHKPGPTFIKTPCKCQIVGVVADGLPAQVNYLADEGVSCGKGTNVVINYLHHFGGNYGLGEQHVHLHADNCSGHNKNNAMLQYLAWRVSSTLHDSVTLSFLLVGNTKFAPDWCFGEEISKDLCLFLAGDLCCYKGVDCAGHQHSVAGYE